MKAGASQNKLFFIGIIGLSLGFLALQIHLNFHEMILPDQFWFIHTVYHKYRTSIPYRDFSPYKTVLGYYLFLIPMSFTNDPFYLFVYIKNFVSAYNVTFLLICSFWLSRFYPAKSILISVALLLSTYFFLNISNDIRVDLFAYWLCLVSALLLMENKYTWAGIVIGVAFWISQKSIWFIFASNAGLAASLLLYTKNLSNVRDIIKFNVFIALTICTYIVFWSTLSSLPIVLNNIFVEASLVYSINLYENSNFLLLGFILKDDILYLSLFPLSFICFLAIPANTNQKRRVFVITYALTSLLLLINYKQVFGYYTVAVIPPLLLLYTDFFSWLDELLHNKITLKISPTQLFLLLTFCAQLFIFLKILFLYLPNDIFLISLVPCLLGLYFLKKYQRFCLAGIYLIILITGIILPNLSSLHYRPVGGYEYQKILINLVHDLTKNDATYVAGIDLLFDKNQPISGNTFLDQSIYYLNNPDPNLKKIMLSSLELDPNITIQKLITTIENSPVKLFVNSPCIERLPRLTAYMKTHYEHLWGNVYIYSPAIKKGSQHSSIKFAGNYQLESKQPIDVNGKKTFPQSIIALKQSTVSTHANVDFRLKLIPSELPHLPKKYVSDIVPRLIYECAILHVNGHTKCIYFF